MKDRRTDANFYGRLGEEYAAALLREKGVSNPENEFPGSRREIDIVARKGDILAFVEVKTRRAGAMVSGYLSVSKLKQKRILTAAQRFMYQFSLDLQPRFDLLCLEISPEEEFQVESAEYYENAFDFNGLTPF